ncbi:MAG: Gfo/Idh/MocA family oxidoreductase [Candidatus Hydrogenedentes bacterium]|nr:Gfo/Idh/MocA family oxidoreductase [Candidatus Hydrogenedentota bacterium]MBI3118065.1 Gfo/Idh/MocA family oxidoreductase [Candidatus Hydrogenedentota bacterium]
MDNFAVTRRAFLAATTTTAALSLTGQAQPNTAEVVPGKKSPNEKLNVAAIGAGGKGLGDIMNASKTENVVALCDVDWRRCEEAFYRLPDAKQYRDYRNMLEEMGDQIDALNVSTPDHTHAPAAYMAMKMGKHVYVQKPLTHTVAEARLLKNTAAEMNVVTQMGNQGHSGDGVRELCEMVWGGAIGPVREAHVWTHRPVWKNQGVPEAMPPAVQPELIDWDRWIGAAPWRPYNPAYAPHDWRAWRDFGGGSLGDMACHIMDPVYMCLKLVEASSYTVEVVMQKGQNQETFPISSTIKYSFPARGEMPPVDVYWYDGHWPENGQEVYNRPKRPAGVPETCVLGDDNANGSFLIGDNGIVTQGEYGGNPRLVPDEKMKDYKKPDPTLPRVPEEDHTQDWLNAIKNGTKSCSDFSYAGPFTEMVNFGNLVVKSGQKLEWDNIQGVVKNAPVNIVSKEYRKGWELPI